jgi:arylsulfatase A-like enzyme
MLTRSFLLAALSLSVGQQAAPGTAGQPNIIVILADDLGYSDVACYGSGYYETPHLDRMALEGLRFTDGYTCGPNCQPTRAALMSGQYGPRTGVYTVGSIDRFDWHSRPLRPVDNVTQLPAGKILLPQALKAAGYATAMFGKWHLGQSGNYHPSKRGFDEALVSMGRHFDFKTDPPTDVPPGAYLADFLTDRAEDFIRRHQEGPFFLYLAHFGVHSPHQAKPDLVQNFAGKPPAGGHGNPTYAAMIASLDESVGRVLALLDELALDDRTLVIFTSDNGGVGGYVREGLKQSGDVTDNAPLRSGKGSLYEGGIRVPYVFRWPGVVPPGGVCSAPICSVDLYPTLLDVAQASPPAEYTLDGQSYHSLLTSGGQATLDREAIYWHFPGYLGAGQGMWRTTPAGGVRMGDWKLLEFFEDGRLELYNLRDDLSETNNLAHVDPDRATEMQLRLAAWRTAIEAPMPRLQTDEEHAQEPKPRTADPCR